MKKILISISPSSGDDYIKAIELVGGKADAYYLPDYLNTLNMDIETFSNMLSNSYDGLILGGGGDVEPNIFDEEKKGKITVI